MWRRVGAGGASPGWRRIAWWEGSSMLNVRACSRRLLVVAASVLFALASVAPAAAAEPIPNSLDALGDSITRGFNACGFFFDCTARSWSTGTYSPVNSHYLRIL